MAISPSKNKPLPKSAEKVFYYVSDKWYKGEQPTFYDEDKLPATAILKLNFEEIKKEIETYYAKNSAELKPNFTPYSYNEQGWKTVNLYSYFLKYPENCKKFPKLDRIANQIPGMCLAQIAVLEPGTTIKSHIGDTDAIIRSHLGIKIPGTLPDCGLRIRSEDRAWKEGEVFSFCIVHRHKAWNLTDDYRIILMIDVIRDEHFEKRYWIAGKTLAVIAMKFFATKFPFLKKMPVPLTHCIHFFTGIFFWLRLRFQLLTGI